MLYIRGQGATGWFGWHDSPEMEQLTSRWLQAEQPARAQELVDAIQRSALQTVPVVPLGQMLPNTSYRNNLQGVLTASTPFFWN
ncbi:MAG: ABC transporter substrate-binding protein, partial [Rhodospirillales bacterium]|nr:ABC transporter substrate-binding protein [Rhodospirillales bacterium]